MRIATRIEVKPEDREAIARALRSKSTPIGIANRLRVVQLAERGEQNQEIAEKLGMGINGVALWRRRYKEGGLAAVCRDRPRSGRPRTIPEEKRLEVVKKTRTDKPVGRTHWSRTSMSEHSGLSESTIGRIWKAHGLKPHLAETFKLSRDPRFEEKLRDIVGLYLNPPARAVVFSVDEKSQIQALDRTQPGLPIKKGRAGTMTHDYKRHGTTTLFAALNVLSGVVTGECHGRHTHKEWLAFLKKLRRETPESLDVHVICDNYATHKHKRVKRWLSRNPSVHVHFTPTSASWLNMVERFFRDITDHAIRRGVFTSVQDLMAAIDVYLIEHNRAPKPFIWTKSANDILAKVARAWESLREEARRLQEAA
jgi:transposase